MEDNYINIPYIMNLCSLHYKEDDVRYLDKGKVLMHGWVPISRYFVKNKKKEIEFEIRYAYSSQIYWQNKIDYIWGDDILQNKKSHQACEKYIIYICVEGILGKDIIMEKIDPIYNISKRWSAINRVYIKNDLRVWKNDFICDSFDKLISLKGLMFSTNKDLICVKKEEDGVCPTMNSFYCGGLYTLGYKKKKNSNSILVSVITVVYNNKLFVEQAIQSVINIFNCSVELIVVDGGSTDGTLDVLKKYNEKINYWVSEKDSGIYDAMNKGLDFATGDYLLFLNSDDLILDPEAFDSNSICRFIKYDAICFNTINIGRYYNWLRPKKRKFDITKYSHQSILTKKRYKYNLIMRYMSDIDYLSKYSNSFVINDMILSGFRIGGVSSLINKEKIQEIIFDKKLGYYAKFYRVFALFVKKMFYVLRMEKYKEYFQMIMS